MLDMLDILDTIQDMLDLHSGTAHHRKGWMLVCLWCV